MHLAPGRALGSTRAILAQLQLVLRLERKILTIIAAYACATGVLFLVIPLTVQELVSTFSFAVEPIMVATLAGIVACTLIAIAAFRVLQARAVEILLQRLYARIALAFTSSLPRFRDETFLPERANAFMETELVTRAIVVIITDLINVTVVGTIGMSLLVLYHPYFLLYNIALVAGFVFLLSVLGDGGFAITQEVSTRHYAVFHWIQNIAQNLPHLRAMVGHTYLLQRTDQLVHDYVMARKARSNILTGTQYKGAALWQAVGHSGLIATAGLMLSAGQLTVGQFAAAEVVVGNLLLNMDVLARRVYALFYVLTSFHELGEFFSLPHEDLSGRQAVPVTAPDSEGIRLSCRGVAFAHEQAPPVFQDFALDIAPGEKVAILCGNNMAKTALAKVLAGLYTPTQGVVRYHGVDLRDVSLDSLTTARGLVLDSHPTLLDGTLKSNIALGRPMATYDQIRWALRFVELDDEIDAMPAGLQTPVTSHGQKFPLSQILRLLVARAIVVRPQLLIFDGTLHSMQPVTREIILRRLCSKDEPWSAVFVSNDPSIVTFTDRTIMLE
jgi:ABC-type bacteriocin/lantibiotic exporter with double-glycine peptidase domain